MARLLVPIVFIVAGMALWAQTQPPAPTKGWRRVEEPQAPPAVPANVLQAPADSAQEPQTFRTGTTLVRVDVQVVNGKLPVSGLRAEDFVLTEEGSARKIEYFGRDSEPLQVLLLLDVSGSMGKLLAEMAEVAQGALASLQPQDQIGVEFFARKSKVPLELTDEKSLAVRVLKEAPLERDLGAGTSINEAVLDAAEYLRQQPKFAGRRALVVLTDNGGMHYQVPDEKVIRALSDIDTVLNAIVPPGAKPPGAVRDGANRNPDFTPANVFALASQTGGEVLHAAKGASLQEMLEHIRVRYSLGITATLGAPGTFRRLHVELSGEARRRYPKAEVRARAGYFTVRQ